VQTIGARTFKINKHLVAAHGGEDFEHGQQKSTACPGTVGSMEMAMPASMDALSDAYKLV